ncbi:ThiF family adenylyltransferase [Burkholderia ubonensis]|uniref:ThiF family adenylyltransferase n=1 Tax=Burkholderia ubonensis TaxID=101571 RepID=UPI0009B45BE6
MIGSTTPIEDQRDACFQVVEARCADRGLTVVRLADAKDGYIGVRLQGATRAWDLYVDCHETALKLPHLSLGAPRGLLAHVGYNGTVCVNDGQGLSLDPDRHADIAAYTILAGFDLLEKSAADALSGMKEFFNEIEGYWLGLPASRGGRAAFEIDGHDRIVTAYAKTELKPPKWFFTERSTPPPTEFRTGKLAAKRALYVHFEQFPMPPAFPDKLGAAFIEAICAKLSPSQLKLWRELLDSSKNGSKRLTLLVSVPRSAGGHSVVGAIFGANRGTVDASAEVMPLTVRRHTTTYMRERGGSSLELMGKHVAVLGCGAVGSVVAEALAAAGVGRLTLIDNDNYSEDNVFRHVLDPLWIDLPKVHGLQYEFERRFPGIRVTAVPETAQRWLEAVNLPDLDGIVLAFGAPSVERSFSRYFRGKGTSLPIVFTWLEALDLGGHSVLVWGDREGCLDCLYRDDEGQPTLHPRTTFLEPDQHVSRNLTGCSSTFVPFGALQARRTGLLAAEHMLSAIHGDAKPSYRFWVGEGSVAAREGLRTTNWWKIAGQTSHLDATLCVFGRPCKRCRGNA